MIPIALFWLLFALPGYALVQRLLAREQGRSERGVQRAGLLELTSLSCLASFLLLSPISLIAYVFRLPVWVLSSAVLLYALGAAIVLWRNGNPRELRALLRNEPVAPWLVLFVLLVLQARLGGNLDGDATYHLGRVRDLLDHGFNNADIYLATFHFQHVYHSNLLHAVYASLAQLTQQSYLDAWFYTQPFAKLLQASGYFCLAYALKPHRGFAWSCTLVLLVASAGETYTLYPNTLAVHWLLPLGLAAGVRCLDAEGDWHEHVATIAACSFVLGQVHSLYSLYLGIVLGPFFAARLLSTRLRARALAYALVALVLGAPFVLVSKYAHVPESAGSQADDEESREDDAEGEDRDEEAQPEEAVAAPLSGQQHASDAQPPATPVKALKAPRVYVSGGGHLEKQLTNAGAEHGYRLPVDQVGGSGFVFVGFMSLLGSALLTKTRRSALRWALAWAAWLALLLFVPPVCALAIKVLQTPFAVARLGTVLCALLLLGICSFLHEAVSRITTRAWAQTLLSVSLLVAATQARGMSPSTFSDHARAALAPAAERHASRLRLHAGRALLTQVLPAGTLVAAQARLGRTVVMLADLHVIAADRGHTHVPSVPQRRADLRVLNDRKTPWPVRKALLDRYGARHVVYSDRYVRRYAWAREHGRLLGSGGGLHVVALR